MNKNKYKKQIGTFSEFYKSKKRQSIKENSSSLEIAVPFWNDALQYALDNLRMLGNDGDSLDWNRMVEKIKLKFSLLNIFDKSFFVWYNTIRKCNFNDYFVCLAKTFCRFEEVIS